MNISTAIHIGLLAGALSISSLRAEEFYWDFGATQIAGSKVLVPNEINELRSPSDAGYTVDKDGDRNVLSLSGGQPEALKTIKKMPALVNATFEIEVKPSASPEVTLIRNGSAWSLRYAETRGFILIVWTQEIAGDGKMPYAQVSLPATTETWHKVVCEITETSVSISIDGEKASVDLKAPPKIEESSLIVGSNKPSINAGTGDWKPFAGSVATLRATYK